MTILALALLSAPAHAATVELEFRGDPRRGYEVIVFKAAPGERNVVSNQRNGQTMTLLDAGATITPLDRACTAIEGGVTCPWREIEYDLGDQDDVANVDPGPYGLLDGGPGNDQLTTTGTVAGGPGEDVLSGPGPFADGDGKTPAHDVYTGTGRSTLSYGSRRTGIRVDLRAGKAGEDTVSGIANVEGGYGDDVLIGDDNPNSLEGNRGGDRILGLGGNDSLDAGNCCLRGSGGGGRETLEGGDGDDRLLPGGGNPSIARCGAGTDETYGSQAFVAADCETVSIDVVDGRLDADMASAGAAFATFPRCLCRRHSFRAFAGRTVVARASGSKGTVTLRLTADGRARLRHAGRLGVTVMSRDGHITDEFRTRLRLR